MESVVSHFVLCYCELSWKFAFWLFFIILLYIFLITINVVKGTAHNYYFLIMANQCLFSIYYITVHILLLFIQLGIGCLLNFPQKTHCFCLSISLTNFFQIHSTTATTAYLLRSLYISLSNP